MTIKTRKTSTRSPAHCIIRTHRLWMRRTKKREHLYEGARSYVKEIRLLLGCKYSVPSKSLYDAIAPRRLLWRSKRPTMMRTTTTTDAYFWYEEKGGVGWAIENIIARGPGLVLALASLLAETPRHNDAIRLLSTM